MTLLGHMVPGAFVGDITFNSCTVNPAFVLDLIESLWAHAAKATVVSNNKPNTIWHLTLNTWILGWLQLEMAEMPVCSPVCFHVVSLTAA